MRFFFSQIDIVFKFNQVLSDLLDSFRHNFFIFFYLVIIDILQVLKFILCLYVNFYKNQ